MDPPWLLRFITRNTRRKKTLKISRPKNDSETKPKQNKTKQNLKKRKKSSRTTYKRKWRSHMITIPGARLFTHLVSGRGSTEDEGVREV